MRTMGDKPQTKSNATAQQWVVYVLRCEDGSLYTGITKDLIRRCQQHNTGTASKYTRSRRPVIVVYQEADHSQVEAMKREAAIKKMTRRGKLAMIERQTTSPKARTDVARLEDIPNVGVSVDGYLRHLGITSPDDLPGRDPYAMYDDLCRITGQRHDPCLLDTFIAAVRYMEGGPKTPWWKFTAERKRTLAARQTEG